MNAKEYLKKYCKAKLQLKAEGLELKQNKELYCEIVSLENNHEVIQLISEESDRICESINTTIDMMKDIHSTLQEIPIGQERYFLSLRYINGLLIEEIEGKLDLSNMQTQRVHRKALALVQDILNSRQDKK